MFRHLGAKRTPQHNLKLATLLGMTAGFVNAAGFLGFGVLTTNVTGHAALFAERTALQDWKTAQVVALWMSLFLAGAFVSSLILSFTGPNQRFSYSIPIFIEILILFLSAIYGLRYDGSLISKEFFAGSLLFAMGLQNALVSVISGSVVRTTHLTGTFTDLGIELAHLVHRSDHDQEMIKSKIKLRLVIIFFFMTGAVIGAYLFDRFRFQCFFVPIVILFYALLYDIFRIKVKRFYQKTSKAVKGTLLKK